MNRSWVRFPQAAQIRPPGFGWAFLCARVVLRCCFWPRWCSGRRVACLDGPGRCVCRWAAARPRDRHTRACGSEWSISRPAMALPPPTGTAARPRHRPRAPQPGSPAPFPPVGPGVLTCGSARRLEARPGSATAHGHRSLTIRRLSCSPHGKRWGFCTTRSLLAACRRRVEPSCSAIPPIGAAAGRGYRVWVSCLEACSILSFACNSLMPAVCSSAKSPEFQRLHFKA